MYTRISTKTIPITISAVVRSGVLGATDPPPMNASAISKNGLMMNSTTTIKISFRKMIIIIPIQIPLLEI